MNRTKALIMCMEAVFNLKRPLSGIELIGSRPEPLTEWPRDELVEFAERLVADKFTFQRFDRDTRLSVGDALAVHSHLDPAVLALNKKGRLSELMLLRSELNCVQLDSFLHCLPIVLEDIGGRLDCKKNRRDPLKSKTTLEAFEAYAIDRRFPVYPPLLSARKKTTINIKLLPPKLRQMVEAFFLFWTPIDQNGSVVPGLRSSEPDLEPHFISLGNSPSISESMASICRPPTAHFGRPRNEYDVESAGQQ